MNVFFQKALGVFTGWAGDGPWRSKSVLAALAAVVAGTGVWFSDIKNSPPQNEAGPAAMTNAPGITLTNTTGAPAQTHRNWSKPFPLYARVGASYVAGFYIGWFFWKLIRLIVIIVALVVALIALGRFVGCDTTHSRSRSSMAASGRSTR